MKSPSASKRAMRRIRKLGWLNPVKRPPSETEIVEIEEKILRGEALARRDTALVMAILKRSSRLGRIVRILARTSEGASAFAIQHLVDQTVEHATCLDRLPVEKLRCFAVGRTAFPMLISLLSTSPKLINERLKKLGVGSEVGPGYRVNSRWKKDAFALVAEQMLLDVFCDPPDLNLDQWNSLWPELRPLIDEYFKAEPSVLEDLKSYVTAPGDRRNASRWKERVVDNIRVKMRALCGVKALH